MCIDLNFLLFRLIRHVQDGDHGDTVFKNLQEKIEVSFKMNRIKDDNQHVKAMGEDHIPDQPFLITLTIQRIDTRKVDYLNRKTIDTGYSGEDINRCPRIITDLHPDTGQM
jgi:hypothetical protein